MSRERFRSIGALIGLGGGVLALWSFGLAGVLWGALFGAGGCVAGAMIAERLHDRLPINRR